MKETFLILFLLMVSVGASHGDEDGSGYIHIFIENRSAFSRVLQVRDDICLPPEMRECEEARLKLKGEKCRENRRDKECKDAAELLEASACIAGLVYDGMVESGQTIEVSVCKSNAEMGRISIRASGQLSPWVQHHLINNGDRIYYP